MQQSPSSGAKLKASTLTFRWAIPPGACAEYLTLAHNNYFDGCLETASAPASEASPGKAQFVQLNPNQQSITVNVTPMRLYYWTVTYYAPGLGPSDNGCEALGDDYSLPIHYFRTYGSVNQRLAQQLFVQAVTENEPNDASAWSPGPGHDNKIACRRLGSTLWRCRLVQDDRLLSTEQSIPSTATGTLTIRGTNVTWNAHVTWVALFTGPTLHYQKESYIQHATADQVELLDEGQEDNTA